MLTKAMLDLLTFMAASLPRTCSSGKMGLAPGSPLYGIDTQISVWLNMFKVLNMLICLSM